MFEGVVRTDKLYVAATQLTFFTCSAISIHFEQLMSYVKELLFKVKKADKIAQFNFLKENNPNQSQNISKHKMR
jgi:hypothetical protein